MPVISTIVGASARAYGFNASLAGVFPFNTVLLWNTLNSTNVPSGWSTYPIDGNFFRCSFTAGEIGLTAAANSSANATVNIITSTSGIHTNLGSNYVMEGPSASATPGVLHYNSPAGGHTHTTMSVNVSAAVPDSITLPVITTTANQATIPANTIIFRKTVPSSGYFTAFDPGVPDGRIQCFYKAGPARLYANSSGNATGTTNSLGAHTHIGTSTYVFVQTGSGASSAYFNHQSAGAHIHTAEVPIHGIPRSKHLNAWVSSIAEVVEYGMIVMYKGDLSRLPSGWRKCDGTLGTPDLTGFILGYKASTAHGADIATIPVVGVDPNPARKAGTMATNNELHTHVPPGSGTVPKFPGYVYSAFHGNGYNPHSHTIEVGNSNNPAPAYVPDHVRVAFIQYKGI